MEEWKEPSLLCKNQMKNIAFIACSKTKLGYPAPAHQLYQGALFKKSLKYCLKNFDEVYILSAKHGLVELTDMLDPYEETLYTKSESERREWSDKVKKQIHKKNIQGRFFFFTGFKYHEFFDGEKPLLGLSIGICLQWFSSKSKKGGFINE